MTARKSKSGKGGRRIPKEPVDQRIALVRGVELTQRYRKAAPASEHSGFFFADGLQALLAQPGVHGMRVYHGLDENGAYRMVLVAVDKDGNDIVKAPGRPRRAYVAASAAATASGDAVLLDGHWPCPPFCPTDSPLN